MDIGLNWNEWHQEAARKPYVRVGVTLLSGALILMSAQEIVSLYLEKNLIPEIEVCATTEDINVSGNDLPEKVTITKQIKEPEKMDEHSFLSAETIQTDVNQADVIQVAAVPAEILVEEPTYGRRNCGGKTSSRRDCGRKTRREKRYNYKCCK